MNKIMGIDYPYPDGSYDLSEEKRKEITDILCSPKTRVFVERVYQKGLCDGEGKGCLWGILVGIMIGMLLYKWTI